MSFKSQAKPDSQSGAERFASAKCGASMSATRLMPHKRKLPREPREIHKNRKFYVSHAFVATPRTCEFHICCARLIVPSVCRDPPDSQVPHLLRASHCAQCLLRPFRHCRASGILRIASSTSYTCADSAQQLLRPSDLQVPHLLRASYCAQCLLDLQVPHLLRAS